MYCLSLTAGRTCAFIETRLVGACPKQPAQGWFPFNKNWTDKLTGFWQTLIPLEQNFERTNWQVFDRRWLHLNKILNEQTDRFEWDWIHLNKILNEQTDRFDWDWILIGNSKCQGCFANQLILSQISKLSTWVDQAQTILCYFHWINWCTILAWILKLIFDRGRDP